MQHMVPAAVSLKAGKRRENVFLLNVVAISKVLCTARSKMLSEFGSGNFTNGVVNAHICLKDMKKT